MSVDKVLTIKDREKLFNDWFDDQESSDNFHDSIGYSEEEFEAEFLDSFLSENDTDEDFDVNSASYQSSLENSKNVKIKELAEIWFSDRMDDLLYDMNNAYFYSNKGIICWRKIKVSDYDEFIEKLKKNEYLESFEGIGECWSFVKNKAEAHWGKGAVSIEIKAIIPFKSIDKKRTTLLNLDHSIGADEAEIRVKKGAKILVLSVNEEKFENTLALVA